MLIGVCHVCSPAMIWSVLCACARPPPKISVPTVATSSTTTTHHGGASPACQYPDTFPDYGDELSAEPVQTLLKQADDQLRKAAYVCLCPSSCGSPSHPRLKQGCPSLARTSSVLEALAEGRAEERYVESVLFHHHLAYEENIPIFSFLSRSVVPAGGHPATLRVSYS